MSPPGGKGKKGGGPPQKPFLGEEELTSELDAWDEMFDNLHGGPEPVTPAPVEIPPRAQTPQLDETDFSEVGASDELPQWADEPDEGNTVILPPDPEVVRGPVVPQHAWDEEEDVYTSASRPSVPP